MKTATGYAAYAAREPLKPFSFQRRQPGPSDLAIDILYCGICHSDIHQARDEWGGAVFPMVPGHEIIGRVSWIGSSVARFREGDIVGVGVFVDSCRNCPPCSEGEEQYCERGASFTYNATEQDRLTRTYGGYSSAIVVDERYALRIPEGLDLVSTAPLLCAGITLYSPLRHWAAGPGKRVAIVGLGGLGHLGIKLAAAMGAEVIALSRGERKKQDALRMGATHFAGDEAGRAALAGTLDLIVDTASGSHELDPLLSLLKKDGTLVLLGGPERPHSFAPFSLIAGRKRIAGSMIGGIRETQEMLDFCAEKGVAAETELIPIERVNEAFERVMTGDVRYRFVVDAAGLRASSEGGKFA